MNVTIKNALVRLSIITFAILQEFNYEFRGNNTCIIQDRTALDESRLGQKLKFSSSFFGKIELNCEIKCLLEEYMNSHHFDSL